MTSPNRSSSFRRRSMVAAVAVAVLLAGCSASKDTTGGPSGSTTTPPESSPQDTTSTTGDVTTSIDDSTPRTDDPTVTWHPEEAGRSRLVGFGEVLVSVEAPDGRACELCMLLADNDPQRHRGLMFVTDPELGGYDGMLFQYGRARQDGFWMRNTRIPLTGLYIDEDGRVVDIVDMEPCSDDTADADCTVYTPAGRYITMIELAARAEETLLLEPGAVLTIDGGPCPEGLLRTGF